MYGVLKRTREEWPIAYFNKIFQHLIGIREENLKTSKRIRNTRRRPTKLLGLRPAIY
jgi:hypothetical protein